MSRHRWLRLGIHYILWFFFTCFQFNLAHTKYPLLNQLHIPEKSGDWNPLSFTLSFLCISMLIELAQRSVAGENTLNTLVTLTQIGFAFLSPWVIHCCCPHWCQQLVWNICFLNPGENVTSHLIDKIWPLLLNSDHPQLCAGLVCSSAAEAGLWAWVSLHTPQTWCWRVC